MLSIRERLETYGTNQLSEQDLISLLIKNKQAAENLTDQFENLYELKMASRTELMNIAGIGPQKVNDLIAAMELGYRLATSLRPINGKATSSFVIGSRFIEELKDEEQEHFIVLCLNTKNEIIARKTISIGTLDQAIVHPRDVFRFAIKNNAARIIAIHNHPSGNPEPSENDKTVTKRLIRSGDILGVEILDHIIVGNDNYVSLRERGLFE